MELIILFGLFAFFIVIGIPIAFSLGIAAFITMVYEGMPAWLVFQRMTDGMTIFSLLAIPFFIFAGELMLHGGIAIRLVQLASACIGWVRGGLGVVNVLASMLFGGISGSAVADTSALGSILIPMMREKNYDDDYSVNVTVTSSVAGILIPPSHNMILYSVAAGGGISIAKLFFAGVFPGMLMCLCLGLAAYFVAVRRGYSSESFPGWKALLIIAAQSIPGLLTAVIIIGGVLSGVFTVTESAAIGAIYALVITGLVYRNLKWEQFKIAVGSAVRTTAMVMILVGSAQGFAWLLTVHSLPEMVIQLLTTISDNKYVVFFLINVILLVLGAIMDMAGLILICTPIFLPVVQAFGMDPYQFGMIMMMNLGVGLCTPPVGGCLFVGCAIARLPMENAVRTIWPFYAAIFVALMLLTYIPEVSLTLPAWLDSVGS
jgi:tripartite ATP-independent transporter DctM subunit